MWRGPLSVGGVLVVLGGCVGGMVISWRGLERWKEEEEEEDEEEAEETKGGVWESEDGGARRAVVGVRRLWSRIEGGSAGDHGQVTRRLWGKAEVKTVESRAASVWLGGQDAVIPTKAGIAAVLRSHDPHCGVWDETVNQSGGLGRRDVGEQLIEEMEEDEGCDHVDKKTTERELLRAVQAVFEDSEPARWAVKHPLDLEDEANLGFDADPFHLSLVKLAPDQVLRESRMDGGAATLIADFSSRNEAVAARVVRVGGLWALRNLVCSSMGSNTDSRTLSEIARAVANLAIYGGDEARAVGWPDVLRKWCKDPYREGGRLQAEARRALINMDGNSGVHLENGLYSLSEPLDIPEVEMDVVFLHGLRGGPLMTWRTTAEIHHDRMEVWPRDWLAREFPRVRILSVGYDSNLTGWSGRNLSLEEQAAETLDDLCAAGVGSRPVVFIGHSYGGLIAKKVYLLAQDSDKAKHQDLFDATGGFLFYGTPHRGSPFARFFKGKMIGTTIRPSSAVRELQPGAAKTEEIDGLFVRSAAENDLDVISVAEGQSTVVAKVRGRAFEVVIVPPGTADAGVGRCVVVPNANHLELCKAPSRDDVRYILCCQLLNSVLESRRGSTNGPQFVNVEREIDPLDE